MKRVAGIVLGGLLAACGTPDGPVAIKTLSQPLAVCEAARVGGILVADPTFGLALANAGYRQGAIWPFGYSARRESGVIAVIDPSGRVVAHEGDSIVAAGAAADESAVNVECDIRVNPSPGA